MIFTPTPTHELLVLGLGTNASASRAVSRVRRVAEVGGAIGNVVHRALRHYVSDNITAASWEYLAAAEAGFLQAQHNVLHIQATFHEQPGAVLARQLSLAAKVRGASVNAVAHLTSPVS